MGQLSGDAYLGPGGAAAAAGGAGVAPAPAGPRQLQAVRRGAVRERRPGQQVEPSTWENVEMAVGEGVDRVSSLSLQPGGIFTALLKEQEHDADGNCETSIVASAAGAWRPCRGGVELTFSDEPELELPDLQVEYRLRRGSLVAEALDLPDGLAQEYARCPDGSSHWGQLAPIAAERLSLIERMLEDATTATGPPEVAAESTSPAAANALALSLMQRQQQRRVEAQDSDSCSGSPRVPCGGDSDSDDCLEGTAPVGIIEDGSNSEAEGSAGGSTPRCQAQVTHSKPPVPCDDKDQRRWLEGKKVQAPAAGDVDEEYVDDFEGESNNGSEDAA